MTLLPTDGLGGRLVSSGVAADSWFPLSDIFAASSGSRCLSAFFTPCRDADCHVQSMVAAPKIAEEPKSSYTNERSRLRMRTLTCSIKTGNPEGEKRARANVISYKLRGFGFRQIQSFPPRCKTYVKFWVLHELARVLVWAMK